MPAQGVEDDADVLRGADQCSALAIANPAQLREFDSRIDLVDLEALREAHTILVAPLLEARRIGQLDSGRLQGSPQRRRVGGGPMPLLQFLEESTPGSTQVLQRLLQRLGRRFFQPRQLFLPSRQLRAQGGVAGQLARRLALLDLIRQRPVPDEAAGARVASKQRGVSRLFAQTVAEALTDNHAIIKQ